MSSCPGLTLEALLEWEYGYTTPALIALYEPYREGIEYWLSQFDEEHHSWRSFASGWDDIYRLDPSLIKQALVGD